jgi:LPXTG-site transpeptidase (sortase) family protein
MAALYSIGFFTTMNIHKSLLFISILLCSVGVAIVAPLGSSWLDEQQALSAAAATNQTFVPVQPALSDPAISKGLPRQLSVPSLNIHVAVTDGSYNTKTGQWTLSDNSASYATITTPVNSASGNTFIYGHATNTIFGNLPHIKNGAQVMVTTDTGYEFTYVYQSRETVKPTDVIALEYSGAKPRLTLQTCSGIWNEARQMFYFELQSYRKL